MKLRQSSAIIAAVSENSVIGVNGKIPWRLAADMNHFKRVTIGNNVVMGRKTYESIGKPLPNRNNIVITSTHLNGTVGLAASFDGAQWLASRNGKPVFYIGGQRVYEAALSAVTTMYITRVHTIVEYTQNDCVALFPHVDYTLWNLVDAEQHNADWDNDYSFVIEKYERIR